MSSSLVADYESDSSSDKDDTHLSSRNPDKSDSTSSGSLTSADILLEEPVHGKSSSIFANPYLDKESVSRDCLEKHVKLTAVKEIPKEKQKTCWKFLKGRCPHGSSCQYSHQTESFTRQLLKATADASNEDNNEAEPKKRKKCGLAQGLVPPKKFMQIYNKSKVAD